MMKLTLQIQVLPNGEEKQRLLLTLEKANEAATFAARRGFESKVYSPPSIQKIAYREIREKYGLSAQMAVRAIGKAAEALSKNKSTCPRFKPHGAITYDERIFSFKGVDKVSLWALPGGRVVVPFVYGEYQRKNMGRIKGQADLAYRDGKFFLLCTVEVPDAAPIDVRDFVGIDMGVCNIACTSDGVSYSGGAVNGVRHRNGRLRAALQRKGTKAAKRRLKSLSGREARFASWVNHNISKQIVVEAERTGRGIAIENLKGILVRVKAGLTQRKLLHSWAFSQLRTFIAYKAKLSGVPVIVVNPRNTSRECAECGHIDKRSRRSQPAFLCVACGHSDNADINAARNIRGRATRKLAEGGSA